MIMKNHKNCTTMVVILSHPFPLVYITFLDTKIFNIFLIASYWLNPNNKSVLTIYSNPALLF